MFVPAHPWIGTVKFRHTQKNLQCQNAITSLDNKSRMSAISSSLCCSKIFPPFGLEEIQLPQRETPPFNAWPHMTPQFFLATETRGIKPVFFCFVVEDVAVDLFKTPPSVFFPPLVMNPPAFFLSQPWGQFRGNERRAAGGKAREAPRAGFLKPKGIWVFP